MQGRLFTEDFLREGVTETEEYRSIDDATLTEFKAKAGQVFDKADTAGDPNEDNTKKFLIEPILQLLDWPEYLPEERLNKKSRRDVPDGLLFLSEERRQDAEKEQDAAGRYKKGIALLEAKRLRVHLDRRTGKDKENAPSTQILRYLSRAEIMSDRAVLWGLLTNGRHWRIYYQGAKSRSEEFLELDLPILLGVDGFEPDLFSAPPEEHDHWLKIFLLTFRRTAFEKRSDGRTFHEFALDEGRFWETKVREDLSDTVFNHVFPDLIREFAAADKEAPAEFTADYLAELRDAAFTFLYRTLFALYAEDRNLLPKHDSKYDDYGLSQRVREDIAKRIDENDALSTKRTLYFTHCIELFRIIDEGDESIGVPPYNGGLFAETRSPLLERVRLGDAAFAPLLDRLSRVERKGEKLRINYRDLTVRQLGAIYERLLEFEPVIEDGEIHVRPNISARKGSGSYYTPDELVELIIERTVGPLVEERISVFETRAAELRQDKRKIETRLAELVKIDPATLILRLKVCDPAMGSGHFLVALVDFLSDKALEAMETARAAVDWGEYVSPLAAKIEQIRETIRSQAKAHEWQVHENQLEDRMLVRRMALKRSVFGVDKNPMAVELAKVSLWLHSFTAGAPLSFLDHHLRCGDSLFGEWVRDVLEELQKKTDFFIHSLVTSAKNSAQAMSELERLADADIAQAQQSYEIFETIEEATAPLNALMCFHHALRWCGKLSKLEQKAIASFYKGDFGDPIKILVGEFQLNVPSIKSDAATSALKKSAMEKKSEKKAKEGEAFARVFEQVNLLIDEERFFHWQVAFPGVWEDWESAANNGRGRGGFDAVIGNPPWDRMKMQEVEWFAARREEIAKAARAADRKKMVAALKKAKDPLFEDYEKARERAETGMALARKGGDYPLLSKGDINIYSLFVERAQSIIRAEGAAGLLTPSGIASDKTASEFFKSVSMAGRVLCLFDFENKKIFFPDVHASFKFCVFVVGGKKNTGHITEAAFFLRSTEPIGAETERVFTLTAEDFALVNPNTGTAPIFRTKRDAEITTAIYKQIPVLVDRSVGEPVYAWPVKYFTMFHMTNDSDKFWTRAMLEEAGAYPTAGNRWKKGKQEFVPLYEGKMVQAFDHRAANVIVNLENLNRPAQPEPVNSDKKSDPTFSIEPQYWVSSSETEITAELQYVLTFKEITSVTNMRTMIALIAPGVAFGNKTPILLPRNGKNRNEALYCANLNSYAFDFVARQKIHGQTINWYLAEQLPVLTEKDYDTGPKEVSCIKLVKDHVLRLTYTAHDMEPFARDMGYDGEPFIWDEAERMHLRARLDALYFLLYGVTDRDDVRHIMSTFPIIQKNDEKEHGFYLTQELILAYMSALEAGDAETTIDVTALKRRHAA